MIMKDGGRDAKHLWGRTPDVKVRAERPEDIECGIWQNRILAIHSEVLRKFVAWESRELLK